MYKYESTQKVFNFLKTSNVLIIHEKIISNVLTDISDDKIYKALSDISKDNMIIRFKRGYYINLLNEEFISKIKASKSERTKFNAIKDKVSTERIQLSEYYNDIRMHYSPLRIAYDNMLTNQIPNLRVCIVDKSNTSLGLAEELSLIYSIVNNEDFKPTVYESDNISDIVVDFFNICKNYQLDHMIKLLNNEYKNIFNIEHRKDSYNSPLSLTTYLYKNINKDKYEQLLKEGIGNYILRIY